MTKKCRSTAYHAHEQKSDQNLPSLSLWLKRHTQTTQNTPEVGMAYITNHASTCFDSHNQSKVPPTKPSVYSL